MQDRRDKRGEYVVGIHGGIKRRRRHRLGQLWLKSCVKQGRGDGERGTHSRTQGSHLKSIAGSWDTGTDMGDSHVGG